MDVEEIAEELYGLKPSDFVAARDRYVAEARKAKDPGAAKAIASLRRPALAVWAANLLARQRPRETRQFLTLGETLREAHRTLDADQLRAASRQQHQLVSALARTASVLAQETGQPVSDTVLHEIEQALHGVLAHPDVADLWSKGRLVKTPEAAVDFATIAPAKAPAHSAPADQPAPTKKPGRKAARLRDLDLERARTAAKEADAEVGRREQELGKARDAQETADGKAGETAERARRLERELQGAQRAKTETAAAASAAGTEVKAAERALREARRVAERAVRAVQGLEQQDES
ncbi:hypothetical protein ABZ572_35240 [Streptomyces sp. NPDC018338]|uniref:hypothetical protein n=1 Tax=Streptomyces sp. NPDC018338 TaxID=3157192 RepID=UPI0033E29540